jgi:hypothetical protein
VATKLKGPSEEELAAMSPTEREIMDIMYNEQNKFHQRFLSAHRTNDTDFLAYIESLWRRVTNGA